MLDQKVQDRKSQDDTTIFWRVNITWLVDAVASSQSINDSAFMHLTSHTNVLGPPENVLEWQLNDSIKEPNSTHLVSQFAWNVPVSMEDSAATGELSALICLQ